MPNVPKSGYITPLSSLGDIQHRDGYIRKVYNIGGVSDDVGSDAYVGTGPSNHMRVSSTISSLNTSNDTGKWSVFVKKVGTSIDTSNNVADLSIDVSGTQLTSDTTTVTGVLNVKNYASFEDDVDLTTGSMTVGKDLTVGQTLSAAGPISLSADGKTVELNSNYLQFSNSWRIGYDDVINGITLQENVEGTGWVTRFDFSRST